MIRFKHLAVAAVLWATQPTISLAADVAPQNPNTVISALKALDYKPYFFGTDPDQPQEYEVGDGSDPRIEIDIDGRPVSLVFQFCEGGQNCSDIQLVTSWDVILADGDPRIDEFNDGNEASQLYLEASDTRQTANLQTNMRLDNGAIFADEIVAFRKQMILAKAKLGDALAP